MANSNNFVDIEEAIKYIRALKIPRHRRRRVWKPFMEKYKCQIICEVGVQEAKNFMLMIEHNPRVAIAIDPWIDDGVVSRNSSLYPQEALDQQYESLKQLAKEKPFIQVVRKYSFDAVHDYPDNYFDFVYIDADHTYNAVLKDVKDWYPKVKRGRFLVGDDYRNVKKLKTGIRFGVIKAVNEFANANGLTVYELPGYNWAIIKI